MYELSTEYWFDSAHFLTDYHGACENLHGHQWRVAAYVGAASLGESGTQRDMVVDFGTLKRIVREECDRLDHTLLVEEGSLKPQTIAALEGEGFSLTMLPFRTRPWRAIWPSASWRAAFPSAGLTATRRPTTVRATSSSGWLHTAGRPLA